jgi:hypothetical protein
LIPIFIVWGVIYAVETIPIFWKLVGFGLIAILGLDKTKLLIALEVNENDNVIFETYSVFFGKDKLVVPLESINSLYLEESKPLIMARLKISTEMIHQEFAVDASFEKELQEKIKTMNFPVQL